MQAADPSVARSRTATATPIELLGVPLLPPPRIARWGNRVRAALAHANRGMAPPPARVLEGVLGSLDTAALAAICRLDVPDRLDRAVSVAHLADVLSVDADRLDRLLRYAATRGWVRIDGHGLVRPTRVTAFLRRGHPGGWRAWVEFAASDEVQLALGALDAGVRAGGDAFAAANYASFFAWMRAHPDRHASFDAAMAAGGRMHGLLLARALEWPSSQRVCDVGGGDGTLLHALLAEHPHLEGVLLDLPEVVHRATAREQLTIVAGDAFRAVPGACDTYLLVNVLHDWDDDNALTLLTRTAEAASGRPGARVIVVEGQTHSRPRDDLATRADLLMLALTPGGRERTTAQVIALAAGARLRHDRSLELVSGDLAHVFRCAGNHSLIHDVCQ